MNKKMGILTLITFLLCLMPSISFSQSLELFLEEITEKSYAVIFDAGSSGSRVHLYHFDTNLNLIRIDEDTLFEFSNETEPGLSAYPNDAAGAAATLIPLLKRAKEKIPGQLIPGTPLILGATAGLRALDGNVSKSIIDKARSELRCESGMNNQIVNIITGKEEGAYMWASVNYLMGRIGQRYDQTMGIIELGGASLQMAYALQSGKHVKREFSSFIKKMKLKDEIYDVYVYSYQNYGGDKFREMIFPPGEADVPNHPCRLREVAAAEDEKESKYDKCRKIVHELFKPKQKDDYICIYPGGDTGCTFDNIWAGEMGSGQHQLFATGSFYYVPANVGMIRPGELNPEVSIKEFEAAAKEACGLTLEDAKAKYKGVKEKYLKNICVDLTYQYAFLTDVLKLDPGKNITLGLKIKHRGDNVTAAWTLGMALERMSKMNLMSFIKGYKEVVQP